MSTAILDAQSAERLCKLLGMLGSHHDGERAAAAWKAHEFVRQLGLTWGDVVRVSRNHGSNSPRDWRSMARVCREQGHRLNLKEFGFVANMAMSTRAPSEKQAAWLASLYARVAT